MIQNSSSYDLSLHQMVGSPVPAWKRPVEWPEIANLIDPENGDGIAILLAVDDVDTMANILEFEVVTTTASDVTVSWGDGTSPVDYPSGVRISRTFDYSNSEFVQIQEGLKATVIHITTSGGKLSSFSLRDTYVPPRILDIEMRAEDLTSLAGLGKARLLQHFRCWKNSITDFSFMFTDCRSLRKISVLDTSNLAGSCESMFGYCATLEYIPPLNTVAATNMSGMFAGCYALKTINSLDTSNVTDMSYMFSGCQSVVEFPPLDTSNVTDMSYMFDSCTLLKEVPALDYSSVTVVRGMFRMCDSLTVFPAFVTPNAQQSPSVISWCANVSYIEQMDFRSFVPVNPWDMDLTFTLMPNLRRVIMYAHPSMNYSFFACALSAEALNEIFTSLPTAIPTVDNPEPYIEIFGNFGADTCDTTIATAKGWEVY